MKKTKPNTAHLNSKFYNILGAASLLGLITAKPDNACNSIRCAATRFRSIPKQAQHATHRKSAPSTLGGGQIDNSDTEIS